MSQRNANDPLKQKADEGLLNELTKANRAYVSALRQVQRAKERLRDAEQRLGEVRGLVRNLLQAAVPLDRGELDEPKHPGP